MDFLFIRVPDENLQMRAHVHIQNKSLTPLMLAVLQHLADKHDYALVRLYSNYWISESDARNDPLSREMRDFSDKFLATGFFLNLHTEPLLVVRTSTVKAMANRGLLKLVGPKRAVTSAGKNKDYARAVLTPQATLARAEIEDHSVEAYEAVLRRINSI